MGNVKNFLCNVYDNVLSKLRGVKPLGSTERLGTVWHFGDKPAHAGQIYSKKVLPNGNVKQRLLTVLLGEGKPMALDTCITKNGEVVSASSGFLNPAIDVNMANVARKLSNESIISPMGTVKFSSTTAGDSLNKVRQTSDYIFSSNPNAKRIYMGGNLKV